MNPKHITEFYKGEPVTIRLFARDPGGAAVIASPASQVIKVTVGETKRGSAKLTFTSNYTLVSATTGEFLITLAASDVSSLTEGETYFYNIWSQLNSEDPRLQKWGKLILGPSIEA